MQTYLPLQQLHETIVQLPYTSATPINILDISCTFMFFVKTTLSKLYKVTQHWFCRTTCFHLPIYGAAIPIQLPPCVQGIKWSSIVDFNYMKYVSIFVWNDNPFMVNFRIDHRLAWSERKIFSGSACGLHSSIPPFVHHDVKSWVFSSYLHCKEQLYLNKR